jgi:hypothetical protein
MLLARYPDGSEYIEVKRNGLNFKKQDSVPAVSDRSWPPLTLALLRHLAEVDSSIDDIVCWGRSEGHSETLIRHMLAWLSFTNQVFYDPHQKLWRCGPEPLVATFGESCQDEPSHDE